jgi:tetratricopeptide (TPR) repeat protein
MLLGAHFQMGDVELLAGDVEAAQAEYEAGNKLARRLAQGHASVEARRDLSVSYNRLGDVALRLKRTDEALGHFEKALSIREKLAAREPSNAQARRDLSVSYERLGDVALKRDRAEEALRWYRKALAVTQALADAEDAQAARDLSVGYDKLGDVTLRLNQVEEALAFFEKALAIRRRLAEAEPNDAQAQRDLSVGYERLGQVNLGRGKIDEALGWFDKALAVSRKLAKDDPGNLRAATDLFVTCVNMARAETARHGHARAAGWWSEARAALLPWHERKLLAGEFENAIAVVDEQLGFCRDAQKAVAGLSFVLAQKADAAPRLFDARVRALLHHRKVGAAVKTADCWADWTEQLEEGRDVQRYDAACALSLCAAASPEKDHLVARAVGVLAKAKAFGYFDDPKRLAHFHKDPDFDAIRGHPAFAAFARSMKE